MNNPKISIICSLSDSRVIGANNRIPWHIREDLIRFRDKTIGYTVIMGRTTFDSILKYYEKSGRPIPKRNHIIVTRDKSYTVSVSNCYVVDSIYGALKKAKETEKKEVFISGGASIFEQTIDIADKLYLTLVHIDIQGDTYFPDYSAFTKTIQKQDREEKGIRFTFLELERA